LVVGFNDLDIAPFSTLVRSRDMPDLDKLTSLVDSFETNITVLTYAQQIAAAIVNGPANHLVRR
jgi:hypothetical protein